MNRLIKTIGAGLVIFSFNVMAFAHPPEEHGGAGHKESTAGKPVTVTGELVDTACFVTSDGDAKGKDHASCATECMSSGVPAGILPEGKDASSVMFLLTNPSVLAPYAAQTIRVEGISYEGSRAIDVKKLFVKEGNGWKEIQLKDAHHNTGDDKKDGHGESGSHKHK
jgi:hypothetical protein